MARFYTHIPDDLQTFMAAQKVFFVATAGEKGRINLSPKGMDSFRCLDPHTVAYLDLTGSGNETAAHLDHDGRLTIMFCSFDENPLIARLYGTGAIVNARDDRWPGLLRRFRPFPGVRQIILMQVDSLQTSCGFAVPVFEFRQERETLAAWAERKGERGLAEFRLRHNVKSIDGLPTGLVDK